MKKSLEAAEIFRRMAEILEIKDDNLFRIRAYFKAAEVLENLTIDIEEMAQEDRLSQLPGIGADLSSKIKEILKTGTFEQFENLKKEVPAGLVDMLHIPGLGPKTVKFLFERLGIKDTADLKKAAEGGKLLELPGIKRTTVENILRGLAFLERGKGKMPLNIADAAAGEIVERLKKLKEVRNISLAGSLRRRKETVRDIDILVVSDEPEIVMDNFTDLPQVKEIIAKGNTKSSILTKSGVQADLRVVEADSYGAALLYFTGSKSHNIKLRLMAQKENWKINEYGLFRNSKKLAGLSEEEMYAKLNMPFIPPELREDAGEIEAAMKNTLPNLVKDSDIRGDLHIHSNMSDGIASLEEIIEAAQRKGYEYIAITDHSQSLKVAGGLSVSDIGRHIQEIRRLAGKIKGLAVLAGSEVDIKDDGSLDYPDSLLKELDLVVCAVHAGFKQSKEKLTNRIIKAIENKYTTIVAHPSGRLLGAREAYELDYDEIFKAAKDTKTFLEINSHPFRLDLTDAWARLAKEKGIKIAISTDSHSLEQLDYLKYGVDVARRGWLEKKDVLNTLPLKQLKQEIKR